MKLTCEAVEDLYVLYQENDLHPSVKDAVDEHLATCPHCQKIYETGDNFLKTKDIKKEDESLKTSAKLDSQIKMKLKLRRMRIIITFMVVFVIFYSFFNYVDKRKSLLYEVSSIEETIRDLFMQMDMVRWDGDIQFTTSGYIMDLNEKTTRLKRYLNWFEKRQLKEHPYQLHLNLNLNRFIYVLHQRYLHDVWTDRDEQAFRQMEEYLEDISRLLTDQRLKLNEVDDLHPTALFSTFEGAQLKELFYKIDHLGYTYSNFQKFPDEIEILSKDEIIERASDVFQTPTSEILVQYNQEKETVQSFGSYSTTIDPGEQLFYATWDAYTGQMIEFDNFNVTHEGELIEEEEVRDNLDEVVSQLFGTDEFRLDYKGVNYHYSSNLDQQLYTYHVIPTHDGIDTNAMSRLQVDARTGETISVISLQKEYYPNLTFTASEVIISKEEGLKQLKENEPSYDFVYEKTIYVPSLLTNRYELVHIYKGTAENEPERTIYLNTRSGEREVIY